MSTKKYVCEPNNSQTLVLHPVRHYMYTVEKREPRLNIRIKLELEADLERLADYYGLTKSSYAHSIIVRAVRKEKEALPELFKKEEEIRGELSPNSNPLPYHEPREDKERKIA